MQFKPVINIEHPEQYDILRTTSSNVFLYGICLYWYSNFTKVYFWRSNWQQIGTGLGDGLVPQVTLPEPLMAEFINVYVCYQARLMY